MFHGKLGVVLYVRDVLRSVDFYQIGLGFDFLGYWDDVHHRVVSEWSNDNPPAYAEVLVLGHKIGIHAHTEAIPATRVTEYHLEVDDVDGYRRHLKEIELPVSAAEDTPWGWRMFHVSDPDGHRWNFYKPLSLENEGAAPPGP